MSVSIPSGGHCVAAQGLEAQGLGPRGSWAVLNICWYTGRLKKGKIAPVHLLLLLFTLPLNSVYSGINAWVLKRILSRFYNTTAETLADRMPLSFNCFVSANSQNNNRNESPIGEAGLSFIVAGYSPMAPLLLVYFWDPNYQLISDSRDSLRISCNLSRANRGQAQVAVEILC